MYEDIEKELERFGLEGKHELEYSLILLPRAKLYIDYGGEKRFIPLGQRNLSKQDFEKIREKISMMEMVLITDGGGGITKTKEGPNNVVHLKYIIVKDRIYYVLDEYDKEDLTMIRDGYLDGQKRTLTIKGEKLTVYEIEKSCFVIVQGRGFGHKHKKIEGSELKVMALTSYEQAIKIIMGF